MPKTIQLDNGKFLKILLPFGMDGEKNIDEIIGRNIKRLRDSKGWTQEELAHRIGTHSDGLISLWERGIKGVGKASLSVLCHVFNVKPYEFYIEDDTPIAKDETEKKWLYIMREAEPLHLREEIERYGHFAIENEKAKKKK